MPARGYSTTSNGSRAVVLFTTCTLNFFKSIMNSDTHNFLIPPLSAHAFANTFLRSNVYLTSFLDEENYCTRCANLFLQDGTQFMQTYVMPFSLVLNTILTNPELFFCKTCSISLWHCDWKSSPENTFTFPARKTYVCVENDNVNIGDMSNVPSISVTTETNSRSVNFC